MDFLVAFNLGLGVVSGGLEIVIPLRETYNWPNLCPRKVFNSLLMWVGSTVSDEAQ